jgi:putative phage-type endonuclease
MMMQRTPEWFAARLGKVTASRIADVMAELKNQGEAVTRCNYRREKVLELYSGVPQESGYSNYAMQAGIEKEAAARNAYSFARGVDVTEVGFIDHPKIAACGASPDGLVGEDGLIEIKCPEASGMFEALIGSPVFDKYLKQVQFQLACTGRKWCDLVTYRGSELPLSIMRISRDDGLIAKIEAAVLKFNAEVNSEYQLLLRCHPK